MSITLADLAQKLGGVLEGDGRIALRGVAALKDAVAGEVAFLANPRYAAQVADTRASAVIVPRDWSGTCPAALIRADNPDKAFMMAAVMMKPPVPPPPPGVHPTAVLAADVQLGQGVSIGPHCVLEAGVRIGDRTAVMAGGYLGHGTRVGRDCRVYPHVSMREGTIVGDRCIVHGGVVIGSDGFGYYPEQGAWQKIPQVGIVEIGDDVELGANVAIDRARFGKTAIGNGVKIDNLVQIAHNVRVGDHTAMAAQVGISGSTTVGRHVQLGGQVGVTGHITIGDESIVLAQSGVSKNTPPRSVLFGTPAIPADKARRSHAHIMRLPALKERVADLQRRIEAIERTLEEDGK